jgi:hypothetical protein
MRGRHLTCRARMVRRFRVRRGGLAVHPQQSLHCCEGRLLCCRWDEVARPEQGKVRVRCLGTVSGLRLRGSRFALERPVNGRVRAMRAHRSPLTGRSLATSPLRSRQRPRERESAAVGLRADTPDASALWSVRDQSTDCAQSREGSVAPQRWRWATTRGLQSRRLLAAPESRLHQPGGGRSGRVRLLAGVPTLDGSNEVDALTLAAVTRHGRGYTCEVAAQVGLLSRGARLRGRRCSRGESPVTAPVSRDLRRKRGALRRETE